MHIQLMKSRESLPKEHEGSWGELVAFLTDVRSTSAPKDKLGGWVPIKLKPGAERRSKKDVESVSCLVFDYDEIGLDQWAQVLELCQDLSYCYHSSYRHQPIHGKLRYRLVIELDRPVPVADWARFYSVVADLFAVGPSPANGKNQPDEQCKDPNRFYYGPHCPLESLPDSGAHPGAALPVDDVLASAAPRASPGVRRAADQALTIAEISSAVPARTRGIDNPFIRLGYESLINALESRPFAPVGQRDHALLAMSAILAKKFPHSTAAAIVAPLAEILDIEEDEPGWPAQALEAKLERDLEIRAQEIADKSARPLQQIGRQEGYTPEQVEGWAARLGISLEELTHQLIINHGASYWVFWNGDWMHLGTKDHAENGLLARLAATTGVLPVALGEEGPKGYVAKTIPKLFRDYGRHCSQVIKDLTIQHSFIDGEVFRFAVCPRDPELQPRYDDAVQAWLESWGEPALLDWCATAARLEKPTAALVLDGDRRTGKTQLARAVARIWNERYTPLRDLGASFNDSISRCPVLYAEESVPWEFRRDTGLLKDLVTADSQQLRQKYQDNATLVGSLRLIIARNDHKLFEAGEVLTKGTVDALCDRLLYVNTGTTRAPYFAPDVIAEHLLWLEQNHKLGPSARDGMWVTGKPSRLHHRMRAFTTKVSASVCYWLIDFLDNGKACGDTSGALHRLDSQGYQINPKLVYEKWSAYCEKEARQPTIAQIADALGGISTRRGNLFNVDLDVLAEYAASIGNKYSDRSALQSKVERSNVELERAVN